VYNYGNWTSIGRSVVEIFLDEFSLVTLPFKLQSSLGNVNFEVEELLFNFEGIQQYENYLMTEKKSEYQSAFRGK
jgi:hypothetical protein